MADPERCEDGPVTIVEFLTARLDHLEDVAKRAAFGWGAEWRDETIEDDWSVVHADGKRAMVGCEDGDVTRHIAANDPAYVLADIAAKRAVIAVHHSFAVEDDGTPDPYAGAKEALWCAGCGFNGVEEYRCRLEECPTLRALVQPFAAHPDFDPTWAREV